MSAPTSDMPKHFHAYDKIERYLRNNLDDADYAEFLEALDSIYTDKRELAQARAIIEQQERSFDATQMQLMGELQQAQDLLDKLEMITCHKREALPAVFEKLFQECMATGGELKHAQAEAAANARALRDLVAKLDQIDKPLTDLCTFAAVHGYFWDEKNSIAAELARARAALSAAGRKEEKP